MIPQPQIEDQARALFWHLIADHADFLSALEARAAFVNEHFFCLGCGHIKHRGLFYRAMFGVVFPCKECYHVRRYLTRRAKH